MLFFFLLMSIAHGDMKKKAFEADPARWEYFDPSVGSMKARYFRSKERPTFRVFLDQEIHPSGIGGTRKVNLDRRMKLACDQRIEYSKKSGRLLKGELGAGNFCWLQERTGKEIQLQAFGLSKSRGPLEYTVFTSIVEESEKTFALESMRELVKSFKSSQAKVDAR